MSRVLILAIVLVGGVSSAAHAQTWQPPSDAQRCPSKWGAGDQRGSANHMKPETVLRAARLIRTGRGHRTRAGCSPRRCRFRHAPL